MGEMYEGGVGSWGEIKILNSSQLTFYTLRHNGLRRGRGEKEGKGEKEGGGWQGNDDFFFLILSMF